MLTEETVVVEDQVLPEASAPRRRKPVRRSTKPKPQLPDNNDVRLKAEFSLPVEQLARLTAANDGDDDYEEIEEIEETDSRNGRNMLFGNGLVSVPFLSPVDDEGRTEHVRDHLRQVSEANAFKAKIWRVPEPFAVRNPLIQRKPTSAPGWSYQGEIAYDPDNLDSDLLTLFSDGFYFVEIRERGTFRSGMLKAVGNPSAKPTEAPIVPPQIIMQESVPATDPLRDASAQAKVMNSVVDAATRLLTVQATMQPIQPKMPTLKDRLEELQMLQQMFAPKPSAQPQRDPMERLAETLESEAMRKILGAIKSDNPVELQQESSGFWDFAAGAVEQLAPGLNPLLAGLGRMLMNSGLPTAAVEPTPKPVSKPAAISTNTASQSELTTEPVTEDDGVDIRFLLQDLADNVAPEQTAQKIKDLMASKPFIRPFLKKYLAADNQAIWNDLIGLAESETEAANLRQSLKACEWRNTWLDSLKQQLQS